jgi:two-component system, cell cycle response regulator DivK
VTRAVVLVVEDNPRNLKLVRDVLEHSGFTVHAATRGEDAVAQAVSTGPDVILMDLQLPGIDGHAALSRLREETRTAGIPVVAFTALAMSEDRRRAMDAGFDGYVTKPISVRDLPDQVDDFVRRAR